METGTQTKSEIIDRANAEFAAHYNWMRDNITDTRLPALIDPPVITNVKIDNVTHRFETEADLHLTIRHGQDLEETIIGGAHQIGHHTECFFHSLSEPTRSYLEQLSNLICRIIRRSGFEIADWDQIPE